jgi:hypothetical protein
MNQLYKRDLIYIPAGYEIHNKLWFGAVSNLVHSKLNIKASQWIHCRETFIHHYFLGKTKRFLFSHGVGAGTRIAKFINEAEKRLGLKKFSTISGFKNKTTRTLIEPAAWWGKNMMRRQFFTILLRCSINYTNDDFEKTLYSVPYTKITEPAVKKFFNGFTVFKGNMGWKQGWVWNFSNWNKVNLMIKQ